MLPKNPPPTVLPSALPFPLVLTAFLILIAISLEAKGELPLVCPVGKEYITREQFCSDTVYCSGGEDNGSTTWGGPCFEVGQRLNGVFFKKLYFFSCSCYPPLAIALYMMCDGSVECPNATDEVSPFCSGRENCDGYCMNGGTCVAGGTCVCSEGWTGDRCADPVCTPECQNGGTCIARDLCLCLSEWTGETCALPVCDPPCANGGICFNRGSEGNKCACYDNWIGPDCGTPLCITPCANGGTCIAPDTCSCTEGYTGSHCQAMEAMGDTDGGIGGDPHFSVTLPDGSSFCYSIQGIAGFPFNLVSSQHFVMNAVFVKPPLKLKQYATLLGEIGVLYRTDRSAIWMRFDSHEKVIELSGYGSLDVTRVHSVTVASNVMSVQSLDKPLNWASNVSVSIKDCGLRFVVFFHHGHLDLIWKEVRHYTYPAHGLVGQFLNKGVRVDKIAQVLVIPNRPNVSVAMGDTWPEVYQKGHMCWKARNPGYQGEGLIQGDYVDYVVDHVFATDFIFSLAKGSY